MLALHTCRGGKAENNKDTCLLCTRVSAERPRQIKTRACVAHVSRRGGEAENYKNTCLLCTRAAAERPSRKGKGCLDRTAGKAKLAPKELAAQKVRAKQFLRKP